MTTIEPPALRDYQLEAVRHLTKGRRDGHRRQLLVAPTAAGKTHIAAYMIDSAVKKGNKVGFLVDRRTLVSQTSKKLIEDFGLYHGIIRGRTHLHPELPVQVASMQTLERREVWPDWNFVFIDECHDIRRGIIERVIREKITAIGLTGTPTTRGLGRIYSNTVNVTTTNRLLEDGWLTPLLIYPGYEIDMENAPLTSHGEWSKNTASERGRRIVGNIVTEYVEKTNRIFGGPVKTLVFSADTDHGKEIEEAFAAVGLDFRQSSFRDSTDKTDRLTEGFTNDEFMGLISVDKFSKGYDLPSVQCLILARPYKRALARVIQELGRGMRLSPDKDQCLVLDPAGNTLGFADELADFFEHGMGSLDSRRWRDATRKEKEERKETLCSCGVVFLPGQRECANCGRVTRRRYSGVKVVPGELRHMDLDVVGKRRWMENRDWVWRQICLVALQWRKGNRSAAEPFARGMYKGMYGNWPGERKFTPASGRADGRVMRRVRYNLDEWRREQRAKKNKQKAKTA